MSLAFSHDGLTLASGSGTYGTPVGEVRLWDVVTGRLLRTMTEADIAIVTIAFSPDDKTVASGGTVSREGKVFGGAVSLWEVSTGKKVMTLPAFPSYIHAVSYAPAGALLATAGVGPNGEGQVVLWETKTWKALKTLTLGKSIQPVTAVKCLAFSPDGKTLAAGGASGGAHGLAGRFQELRSPVRFDGVFPVRVERLEPDFQLTVAVLGLHGLQSIAISGGLAEEVLYLGKLGLDLADLALEIGGLAIRELLLRAAVAVHGPRAGRSRGCRPGTGLLGGGFFLFLDEILIGLVVALDHPGTLRAQDDQPVGHLVEKIAVVADDQHRAVELAN